MPHFVYIVRCADGNLYVGSTSNVEQRLAQHNNGRGGAYTAARRPVALAYCEACPDLLTSRRRERQIKGWTVDKKRALIEVAPRI